MSRRAAPKAHGPAVRGTEDSPVSATPRTSADCACEPPDAEVHVAGVLIHARPESLRDVCLAVSLLPQAAVTPALVKSMAQAQPGVRIQLPPPGALDAFAQYLKNLDQFILIAIVSAPGWPVMGEWIVRRFARRAEPSIHRDRA